MAYQMKAKGHVAQCLLFDSEAAFLPLNEEEATWLYSALQHRMQQLIASGDFPEKTKYENLLFNISTTRFLLSEGNVKIELGKK